MADLFIADGMLKKLARWLRIFGAKVIYTEEEDSNILQLLLQHPNLILLTQDRELHNRALGKKLKSFLVPRNIPMDEQIALLFKEFELDIDDFPSKTICPKCNGELKTVSQEEVKEKIPDSIRERHEKFWLCSECGQVYWEGSHWRHINETAEKVRNKLKKED